MAFTMGGQKYGVNESGQAETELLRNKLYEAEAKNADYNNIQNFANQLEQKVFGDSANSVGKEATDFRKRLYDRTNMPSVTQDLYRQKMDMDINRANTKAGLAGIDTTAGKAQESANAALKAKAMANEDQSKAMAQYGQSVGAAQNAVAQLWLGAMGLQQSAKYTPPPEQDSGLFGLGF